MTGFLLVDKPPGPTSHDMVDAARRALGTRRVGHAGTLDPPASGLLVIAAGPATRLLQYVQRMPKTYETRGELGVRTSTLDAAGDVVSTSDVHVSEQDLRDVLPDFTGVIEQRPPAVSAVKIEGERAYKRAARGEVVAIQPRHVTVYEIALLGFQPSSFTLRVTCSAGTYVRSLVADLGDRLGCGAHVAELRRTAVGHLRVEDAVAPGDVSPARLVGPADVLPLPVVTVDAAMARRARDGQRIEVAAPDGEIVLAGPEGMVGVFEARGGRLRALTVVGS